MILVADLEQVDFPLWLRATHWINFFFIGFLIRSGIQILAAFPRLYINNSSKPGSEWLKLTWKKVPKGKPWTPQDEGLEVSSLIAQPGGNNLELGRYWHFFSSVFWILNGVIYVVLLFISGVWRDIIPTSWSIFPRAWGTLVGYATFHLPPASDFTPFDPLQKLAYFVVIFLLAPLLIATGAAQSQAIEARFPWYSKLFGGRQGARTLHFLGLLAFIGFIIVHVGLVIIEDFPDKMGDIVLGSDFDQGRSVAIGLTIIGLAIFIYLASSWLSRKWPEQTKIALGQPIHRIKRLFSQSK